MVASRSARKRKAAAQAGSLARVTIDLDGEQQFLYRIACASCTAKGHRAWSTHRAGGDNGFMAALDRWTFHLVEKHPDQDAPCLAFLGEAQQRLHERREVGSSEEGTGSVIPRGGSSRSPVSEGGDHTAHDQRRANMSDDAKAAKELVETLKDGERGFADAADKLRDSEHPQWAETLQRLSQQRAGFSREIVELGHEYGDDVDASGSVAAAVHRGWISLKDAVTGDDTDAVLKAVETGEDHAVSEYEDALKMDLSAGFRDVVVRQQAAVLTARDEVKALQAAG